MRLILQAETGDAPVWGNLPTAKKQFRGLSGPRIEALAASGQVVSAKVDRTRQAARLYLLFGEGSIDEWLRRQATERADG